ncbi:MAG: peptide deformylase [Proteobacteria bacterium]|nr:peptide deformylase [Pseudomonadota bacterium]
MTVLKILQYPDKRLKRIAVPVENFDQNIQKVIDDMFETHYATAHCAALASTQLDLEIPWHITVIDYSQEKNAPLCLVNGKIIHREGEQIDYEGCMSVYPDHIHEKVKRAKTIKVQYQDRLGNPHEIEAHDLFAKCIQHELDHLNGTLYIDHLHPIKIERIQRKVKKILRQAKN